MRTTSAEEEIAEVRKQQLQLEQLEIMLALQEEEMHLADMVAEMVLEEKPENKAMVRTYLDCHSSECPRLYMHPYIYI